MSGAGDFATICDDLAGYLSEGARRDLLQELVDVLMDPAIEDAVALQGARQAIGRTVQGALAGWEGR